MYNERSLENLRPFNTLSPEDRRDLARMGGLASGARRRYLADLRLAMIETMAGYDLANETREEYQRAIKRYVKEEQAKQRHAKSNKNAQNARKCDHKKRTTSVA